MNIGIIKEKNDKRVGMIPATMEKLSKLGVTCWIEKGAGTQAGFPDKMYEGKAQLGSRDEVLQKAEVLVSINAMPEEDMKKLKPETVVIALFVPLQNLEIVDVLKKHKLRAFSMDMVPRTTRAQNMDVLSSMASIAGYKSVLVAADHLPSYFPMMITAAGSIPPAKVVILGAGVAGLQAIATAKRLGAMVEASDVRQAAKEEVLSLGAKFIEVEGAAEDTSAGGYAVQQSKEFLEKQRQEVQRRAAKADVIITTAQVRGGKAPVLLPKETVEKMKPGSVIVDIAASTGGNCELTKNGEVIQHNGVTIIGNSKLEADMPHDASMLYSNNLLNFLKLIIKEGQLELNMEDDIVEASYITKEA